MEADLDNNQLIIKGTISLSESNKLRIFFNDLMNNTDKKLEIHFINTSRIQSHVLAKILILNEELAKQKRTLCLKTNNPDLYEMFCLLKLNELVTINKI